MMRGYLPKAFQNSLGTDHHEDVISNFNADELEKLLNEHIGQPFVDSSILPTAKVSKLASRHVKVALSGDGGDELFCGYQRYKSRKLISLYSCLPEIAQEASQKSD